MSGISSLPLSRGHNASVRRPLPPALKHWALLSINQLLCPLSSSFCFIDFFLWKQSFLNLLCQPFRPFMSYWTAIMHGLAWMLLDWTALLKTILKTYLGLRLGRTKESGALLFWSSCLALGLSSVTCRPSHILYWALAIGFREDTNGIMFSCWTLLWKAFEHSVWVAVSECGNLSAEVAMSYWRHLEQNKTQVSLFLGNMHLYNIHIN